MIYPTFIAGLLLIQVNGPNKLESDRQLDRFKKRIGFEDRVKGINKNPGAGMIGPWPDMRKSPWFGPEWECESTERSWSFRKGTAGINISVSCSIQSPEEVKNAFIDGFRDPMHKDITFVATEHPIGAISCRRRSYNGFENDEVRVWNNNWRITVSKWNSDIDIIAIAEWLNAFAETKVVPDLTKYLPKPKSIEVTPNPIKVGVPLEVKVTPPADEAGRYVLKSESDGEYFRKLKHREFSRTYRPNKSGKTHINFRIDDKQTLLEYSFDVPIEILD